MIYLDGDDEELSSNVISSLHDLEKQYGFDKVDIEIINGAAKINIYMQSSIFLMGYVSDVTSEEEWTELIYHFQCSADWMKDDMKGYEVYGSGENV